MNELPLSIQRSVRSYLPIEADGIVLYPVKVKEYEQFLAARPALEVLHQSLPVALMRIPLLSALYQMDYEAAQGGTVPTGLFYRALLGLALSLRLGEGKGIEERIEQFRVTVDREKPEKLIRLQFTDEDGEEKEILPASYQKLRRIIAAQNGVTLESEDANPAIVEAQRKMAEVGSADLEYSLDDLISAVALLSHADESEIEDWTILKFNRRSESATRILRYMVCGVGEANGATWKGGNPAPHPFFKKARDGGGLLTPMGGEASGGQQRTAPPPLEAQELAMQSKNM